MHSVTKILGILGLLAPVIVGSVYVGDLQNRVFATEEAQKLYQADHDRVVQLEQQYKGMKDDLAEIKGDVKELLGRKRGENGDRSAADSKPGPH